MQHAAWSLPPLFKCRISLHIFFIQCLVNCCHQGKLLNVKFFASPGICFSSILVFRFNLPPTLRAYGPSNQSSFSPSTHPPTPTHTQVDACLAALARLRDPSVAADLLSQALPQLRRCLTLDSAAALLPIAHDLLHQRYHSGSGPNASGSGSGSGQEGGLGSGSGGSDGSGDRLIVPYAACGLECVQLVLESFAGVIAEARTALPAAGVDVAREMRCVC